MNCIRAAHLVAAGRCVFRGVTPPDRFNPPAGNEGRPEGQIVPRDNDVSRDACGQRWPETLEGIDPARPAYRRPIHVFTGLEN